MKEAEKEQMKKLNNSLVNYIDKVHDLEQMVKRLSAENARLLKKTKKGVQEVDIGAMYEAELKRLRVSVESLQGENIQLAIERDNKVYEYEETYVKLQGECKKVVAYEKEIDTLRKDVDDATIERSKMEGKIESLMEQLALERQVHQAEMENLRSMVQPVEVQAQYCGFEEKPSLLPDLTEAIANVRKEYEAFNAKSLEDLDHFYKEKVEGLNFQVKNLQVEIRDVKSENVEKRREVQRIEMELSSLRQKKITLEKTIEALEARLAEQDKLKEAELAAMRAQLDNTKQDLGKYLKQYQELNALKLSLDQEISIYRKLITGEEVRISEVDTSYISGRSRSHSRSNRSRSSSSSSGSSRSRSGERGSKGVTSQKPSATSKANIVDQMIKSTNQQQQQSSAKVSLAAKGKGSPAPQQQQNKGGKPHDYVYNFDQQPLSDFDDFDEYDCTTPTDVNNVIIDTPDFEPVTLAHGLIDLND